MIDLSLLTGWDWIVVLIAIVSMAFGIWRGLVRTAAGLLAWVGAFLLAPIGASLLGPMLGSVPGWVQLALAFLLGFLLIQLGGAVLARLVHGIGLGGVDRALGALLGLARGLAITGLLATSAVALGLEQSPAWQQATSRNLLESLVDLVYERLGERLPKRVPGSGRDSTRGQSSAAGEGQGAEDDGRLETIRVR